MRIVRLRQVSNKVRQQVCSGCWRTCRYSDFKPLKTLSYKEVRESLCRQVEAGKRIGSRAHITRRTVLGAMHEMKQEEWEHTMEQCPHQGENYPKTISEFLAWAERLHAVTVRMALGDSKKKARGCHAPLKVHELVVFAKQTLGPALEERDPF